MEEVPIIPSEVYPVILDSMDDIFLQKALGKKKQKRNVFVFVGPNGTPEALYKIEINEQGVQASPKQVSTKILFDQFKLQLASHVGLIAEMINKGNPELIKQIDEQNLISNVKGIFARRSLRSQLAKAKEKPLAIQKWIDECKKKPQGFFSRFFMGDRLAKYKAEADKSSPEEKIQYILAHPDDAQLFLEKSGKTLKLNFRELIQKGVPSVRHAVRKFLEEKKAFAFNEDFFAAAQADVERIVSNPDSSLSILTDPACQAEFAHYPSLVETMIDSRSLVVRDAIKDSGILNHPEFDHPDLEFLKNKLKEKPQNPTHAVMVAALQSAPQPAALPLSLPPAPPVAEVAAVVEQQRVSDAEILGLPINNPEQFFKEIKNFTTEDLKKIGNLKRFEGKFLEVKNIIDFAEHPQEIALLENMKKYSVFAQNRNPTTELISDWIDERVEYIKSNSNRPTN